jgi:hypothetical protein
VCHKIFCMPQGMTGERFPIKPSQGCVVRGGVEGHRASLMPSGMPRGGSIRVARCWRVFVQAMPVSREEAYP